MKVKVLALSALVIAMSGCAARVKDIPTGHGDGHLVECNGAFSGWAKCYNKAAELCQGSFSTENEQAVARTFGGAFLFGSAQERSMVVQCVKDED